MNKLDRKKFKLDFIKSQLGDEIFREYLFNTDSIKLIRFLTDTNYAHYSLGDLILRSFSWRDTPQGYSYWIELAMKYKGVKIPEHPLKKVLEELES